ncbi:hypothetical protein BKA56DRAFT_733787 [Ilyonectria sp. MPI-CAGE-AT-0026]|nr:hypothetical protein BKA56DRAFT_733787 [Ilyonectria sp. MPI-CAGE-AT-0026]
MMYVITTRTSQGFVIVAKLLVLLYLYISRLRRAQFLRNTHPISFHSRHILTILPSSQPPTMSQHELSEQAVEAKNQQQPVQPVQANQPAAHQAMDPQRPHPNTEVNMRGGDRGGCCPGRFCFCIPCPLPCDCCIIPL